MWKAIVKWIESKSYRCEHDWELVVQNDVYFSSSDKMPHTTRYTYRCTKCCDFKNTKA